VYYYYYSNVRGFVVADPDTDWDFDPKEMNFDLPA